MRKTTQKRTKRRRTTSKRIRRNKVIYGGEDKYIKTKDEFDKVEGTMQVYVMKKVEISHELHYDLWNSFDINKSLFEDGYDAFREKNGERKLLFVRIPYGYNERNTKWYNEDENGKIHAKKLTKESIRKMTNFFNRFGNLIPDIQIIEQKP